MAAAGRIHRIGRRRAEGYETEPLGKKPSKLQYYIAIVATLSFSFEVLQVLNFTLGRQRGLEVFANNYTTFSQKDTFSIEIFSAPNPFVGTDKEVNLRAIRSWQRLRPKPTITLLGLEEGYAEVAEAYGLRIITGIDKTFLGVPHFNSMFHIANQSKATISVIINGDIILLDDFTKVLAKVLSQFKDFLLVSARYDLQETPAGISKGDSNYYSRLRKYSLQKAALQTNGGMDLWAWNPNGPRLFDVEMPHFIFGRGKYDHWLTHETITAGRRQVIDASEAILSIHIRHGDNLVPENEESLIGMSRQMLSPKMSWSADKKSKFELFINSFLSLNFGSYKNQYGSVLFAPWRIAKCLEPGELCLVKRKRPGVCNCEYSSSSVATETDPLLIEGSRAIRCGAISQEDHPEYAIPTSSEGQPRSFGMPLTASSVSEKVGRENTIIVTALNYAYRDMMMNWVCNLRRLRIFNFVIAALDEDLYKYAFVRGLPVYLEGSLVFENLDFSSDEVYDSAAFKQLTKVKSRVVLRFLKLGYDTLWSDVDVVWFKNPLHHLRGQAVDLAIQSNAPDSEPANGHRRIGSGFYLARSNMRLVNVFEEIVKYAAASNMSEQPCFFDVICGKDGERRRGNVTCVHRETTTKFLDRTLYPNGKTMGIWEVKPGSMTTIFPEIVIAHNNLVRGATAKRKQLKRHKFIFHDSETGLCDYKRMPK